MIRKISFGFVSLRCASSYAFFILIQKKSEVETQIEQMESLKEIASSEQETKEMNLEHSNRYSRERAINQELESRN